MVLKETPHIIRNYMYLKGSRSRNHTLSRTIADVVTASDKHVYASTISRLKYDWFIYIEVITMHPIKTSPSLKKLVLV